MTAPSSPSMAPSHEWEGSQASSPRQRRRRLRLALVVLILAIYAAGVWFFSSHLTPGTTVDGVDAAMMTQEELAAALTERTATYQQTITSPDGFSTSFTGDQVGLSFDSAAVAQEAFDRSIPLLWLPKLLSPSHMLIDGKVTTDEAVLTQLVDEAVTAFNEGADQPKNAYASYDGESGTFVTSKESVGTALDAQAVVAASELACRELRQDVVLGEDALLQPTITDQDERLATAVEAANATLAKDLAITLKDKTVATITPQMKAGWLYLDDDLVLSVDAEQVLVWIASNEDLRAAGSTTDDVHVWELDALNTADITYKAIRDAKDSCEMALALIETKPELTPGAKERGRHIDVNLTTQFARFYDSEGKVIWDSYFVSGNVAEGRQTPTGDFAIEAKQRDRVLVGADEDKDGKPDYESFVSYWMPFLAGDWGLHDATWRWDGEFGGTTYQWNGSHGCINLPFDKAESLYGLVEVGDPVIVHY